MAVRTYAPRGHTPVLRVKLTYDHLSAIGGITPDGRLLMQSQDHAYCAQDVVRFLRLLLRKLPGKLLVIWDGATIHRAQAIKDFLSRGAAKRIHLERLPGYAPELNPQEGVWNLLKRREREAMSVAVISRTSLPSCDWPKNVCDIGVTFYDSVSLTLAVLFSSLC